MKIDSIYIERFGTLREKRLEDFQPGVEVIYAPNESGKTTFIQFVRCMLFGLYAGRAYAGEDSQRMSGRLTFSDFSGQDPTQRLTISRILRTASFPVDEGDQQAERVELFDNQKRPQSLSKLDSIFGDVDAQLYGQVFAVFQDDLSSFSLLSSEAAAQVLYDISMAQPQTPLSRVVQILERNRREALNNVIDESYPDEGRLQTLLNRRQALLNRLEKVNNVNDAKKQAINEIPELQSRLEQTEEQIRQSKMQIAQYERMEQAIPLFNQYKSLGTIPESNSAKRQVAQYDIDQAESLQSEITNLKSQINSLDAQISKLPVVAPVEIKTTTPVKRSVPDDLLLLQSRRADFQREAQLARQLEQVDASLSAVWTALDLPGECRAGSLPGPETLSHLVATWKKKDETHQVTEDVEETIAAPVEQVSTSTDKKLAAINHRLGLLREKLHWIERRNDLEWGEEHLRNQLTILNSTPVMSTTTRYTFMVITALGLLGVLLWTFYLFGWLSKDGLLGHMGSLGVVLCFCGLAGVAIMRYMLDKAAEEKLFACRNHWEAVKEQLDEHLALAPELESRLRASSSAFDVPVLREGESPDDLSDTRNAIAQLVAQAQMLADERDAKDGSAFSARNLQPTTRIVKKVRTENVYSPSQFTSMWTSALRQAGLPTDWSIEQVKNLQKKHSWIAEQFSKRASLERQRQSEAQSLAPLRQKLVRLLERSALSFSTGSDLEQIDRLTELFSQPVQEEEVKVERREVKDDKRDVLLAKKRDLDSQFKLAQSKLEYIFNGFNVTTIAALKDVYSQQSQATQKRQRKTELFQKIQAALERPVADVNELYSIMKAYPESWSASAQKKQCEQAIAKYQQTKRELESKIKELATHNSQLETNLQQFRTDQQSLTELENEIAQTARKWRAAAMAQTILQSITKQYENDLQPKTLKQASDYFQTITDGEYINIHKPTDVAPLQVERVDGKRLTVGQLSTGTREQLYLCLRMALVGWYANKDVVLPFLLDDSLANFDSVRVKSAAKLLLSFSKQGIQTILLTCHKSVRDAFEKLGVKTRRF